MRPNHKYALTQYMPLLEALKRDQVPNPGRVARLFLTVFTAGKPVFSRARVEDFGPQILAKDGFKAWRKEMGTRGWIIWHGDDNSNPTNKEYEAGPKLQKYILRELAGRLTVKEIAIQLERKVDRDEVEQLRENFQEQIRTLWEAIRHIEESNPPVTEEKLKSHLNEISVA